MLSVVAGLRNDGHGERMLERTNTFLSSLAQQAARHRVSIEFLLAEWNPPAGRASLVKALAWPKNEWFTGKVVTIPPEIHNRYGNSNRIPFYQMIAKNVIIRRATMPWILSTNPDLIYSDKVFEYIKSGRLKKGRFYRVFRHDVKQRQVQGRTIEERLAFCKKNVGRVHSTEAAGLHTHACGDFTLLHRDDWFRTRAYPEFDLWSIHIDSVFLYWARHCGLSEVVIPGAAAYHIEHKGSWVMNPELANKFPHLASGKVGELVAQMGKGTFKQNGANWGLADVRLKEYVASQGNKRLQREAIAHMTGLTIFAVPKAFTGEADLNQRNAIGSWLQLKPRPRIVLIGGEAGVAEFAKKDGLTHHAEVKTNSSGTPTLDGVFEIIKSAQTDHVMFINADIVLFDDFMTTFANARDALGSFLMIGRRTNHRLKKRVDFGTRDWKTKLRKSVANSGQLDTAGAIDYFVFRKDTFGHIPPFAIGRTTWDNWLAGNLKTGVLVDATKGILAVHLIHDRYGPDSKRPRTWAFDGPEAKRNQQLGSGKKLHSVNHATYLADRHGTIYRKDGQPVAKQVPKTKMVSESRRGQPIRKKEPLKPKVPARPGPMELARRESEKLHKAGKLRRGYSRPDDTSKDQRRKTRRKGT